MVHTALVVAACAKLVDHEAFRRSLETWELVPSGLHPVLAVLVPAVELGLGLAWWLGVRRRVVGWLAVGLLGLFTGVYGAHWVVASPPDCNCLGTLLAWEHARDQAYGLFVRNAVLIVLAGFGAMAAAPRSRGET